LRLVPRFVPSKSLPDPILSLEKETQALAGFGDGQAHMWGNDKQKAARIVVVPPLAPRLK
jgi:hypothetical protein